jgi:serine/threonine protein phosphatase PrpC
MLPDRIKMPTIAGVLVPESVEVNWGRQELGRPLREVLERSDEPAIAPSRLATEMVRLVTSALQPLHDAHYAGLDPSGLRIHGDRLFAATYPRFAGAFGAWPEPFGDPRTILPMQRDLYLLGVHLYRAATKRWPATPTEILDVIELLGGNFATGIDVALRLSLHPDVSQRSPSLEHFLASVRPFLEGSPQPCSYSVGAETVTGWRKSRGDPHSDNEDSHACSVFEDGDVVAAVFDGVTGDGNGAGFVAAHALEIAILESWKDVRDPGRALASAHHKSLPACDGWSGAAAAAVAIHGDSNGNVSLAGSGDCRCYLARQTRHGYRVTRLLDEDSLAATRLAEGAAFDNDDRSVLTQCLIADDPDGLHEQRASLRPSDYLVLLSDGAATRSAPDRLFADDLERILSEGDNRAQLVASLLCRRAEEIGGFDNATALVVVVKSPRVEVA